MGFSGDFWFGIFVSNMSLMQMGLNTEEGDLVKKKKKSGSLPL